MENRSRIKWFNDHFFKLADGVDGGWSSLATVYIYIWDDVTASKHDATINAIVNDNSGYFDYALNLKRSE